MIIVRAEQQMRLFLCMLAFILCTLIMCNEPQYAHVYASSVCNEPQYAHVYASSVGTTSIYDCTQNEYYENECLLSLEGGHYVLPPNDDMPLK